VANGQTNKHQVGWADRGSGLGFSTRVWGLSTRATQQSARQFRTQLFPDLFPGTRLLLLLYPPQLQVPFQLQLLFFPLGLEQFLAGPGNASMAKRPSTHSSGPIHGPARMPLSGLAAVRLSIWVSIHPSTHMSRRLPVYPSLCLSIHRSILLTFHPHPSVLRPFPSIHLSVCPHLSVRPSPPSSHPSVLPSIQQSRPVHPSIVPTA
jgi:hypothetical protein